MNETTRRAVRLALPSKGALARPTLSFLAACGLKVHRPNERQYIASVPAAPQVTVLFQRAADIFNKVAEGSADFGITGYDVVSEQGLKHSNVILVWEKLGYGGCELVFAVPDSWIDVSSIEDLADLSLLYREKGRELRIATKYPNLTKEWLYDKGILHFSLVEASGALEVAPSMGYADLIVDITSTGTTLRENHLKMLVGGTIIESEACLIGNKRALRQSEAVLHTAGMIIELIEAHLKAKKYLSITANIRGKSPQAIAQRLNEQSHFAGLQGPTISKVYSKMWSEEELYAVKIVVERALFLPATHHLRKCGGTDIVVASPDYLFDAVSWGYEAFLERLKRDQ